jgi:hypothetical protein
MIKFKEYKVKSKKKYAHVKNTKEIQAINVHCSSYQEINLFISIFTPISYSKLNCSPCFWIFSTPQNQYSQTQSFVFCLHKNTNNNSKARVIETNWGYNDTEQ